MTSQQDTELEKILLDLVLKFRNNGYWDDALLELEPHNREFVDDTSWAGELHWEAMQKLHVKEIMEALTSWKDKEVWKEQERIYDFATRRQANGLYVPLEVGLIPWLKDQLESLQSQGGKNE